MPLWTWSWRPISEPSSRRPSRAAGLRAKKRPFRKRWRCGKSASADAWKSSRCLTKLTRNSPVVRGFPLLKNPWKRSPKRSKSASVVELPLSVPPRLADGTSPRAAGQSGPRGTRPLRFRWNWQPGDRHSARGLNNRAVRAARNTSECRPSAWWPCRASAPFPLAAISCCIGSTAMTSWFSASFEGAEISTRYSASRIRRMAAGESPVHCLAEIMSGPPVFVGTRVPFETSIDYLAAAQPRTEFLEDFPTVSKEQAIAALQQAKEALLRCVDPWLLLPGVGTAPEHREAWILVTGYE